MSRIFQDQGVKFNKILSGSGGEIRKYGLPVVWHEGRAYLNADIPETKALACLQKRVGTLIRLNADAMVVGYVVDVVFEREIFVCRIQDSSAAILLESKDIVWVTDIPD